MTVSLGDLSQRTTAIWAPELYARVVHTLVRQAGGRRIISIGQGREISAILARTELDVFLVDEQAASPNAYEILKLCDARPAAFLLPAIVLMASRPTRSMVEEALSAGIGTVIAKPFSARSLLASVARAVTITQARSPSVAKHILLD